MKISLLPPTRGRPFNMERMWRSAYETAARPDLLEIVWYIDDDDADSIEQYYEQNKEFGDAVKAMLGPRCVMSDMHNQAFNICSGDIVSYIGDDVIFQTKHWDEEIRYVFTGMTDKIGVVYPRDGINNEKLAVHGFIHRNWVNITGYVTFPKFVGFYADTFNFEIAHNLRRRYYLPHVFVQHMHCSIGLSAEDATTKEMYVRHNANGVANTQMWYNSLPQRVEDTKKLLAYINHVNGTSFELRNYERIL